MKNKKIHINPGHAAALAAGGVIGGNIARHNILGAYHEHSAKKAPRYNRLSGLVKNLKPGDVFFSRSSVLAEDPDEGIRLKELVSDTPLNKIPGVRKVVKNLPTLKERDLIRSYGGHKLYHAGIYTGKGHVVHAPDEEAGVVKERLSEIKKQYPEIRFYRPHKASGEQVHKAVDFANKNIGKRYSSRSWITKDMLKELLLKRKRSGKTCNDFVCTTLVTNAYPEQFKHEWAQPAEMIQSGKLKPVANVRSGHEGLRGIGAFEKSFSNFVQPVVRSAKFAIPAAGLAYATKKIIDANKKK